MKFEEQVALVTGANRGIGRRFVEELHERGVSKIYAAARRPEAIDWLGAGEGGQRMHGVEIIRLDITDHASVVDAARIASDVTLLVNNAGISTSTPLIGSELADVRRELDTHFWGTLDVVREFAPVLGANGGGAIVNILSALSWFVYPGNGAYAVAKAAEWNMTNSIRLELAPQGTLVQGVHLGAADTDIMAGYDGPMIDPRDVPRASLAGLENGAFEVVVDKWSADVKASLAADPAEFYRSFLAG